MRIINYDIHDPRMNKTLIEFIANELKNNTYKILGISGNSNDIKWGHYIIIGKNNGDIVTFDPSNSNKIIGIDNIIKDFEEDNIVYLIDYYNGLIVDRTLLSAYGKKKRRTKTNKKNLKKVPRKTKTKHIK